MNHPYFILTLKYKYLNIYLLRDAAGFLKITLNIPFKKVVLPGRVKRGGTEGEIVVAHGRLPSPAPSVGWFLGRYFLPGVQI